MSGGSFISLLICLYINLSPVNVSMYTPLKTPENLWLGLHKNLFEICSYPSFQFSVFVMLIF